MISFLILTVLLVFALALLYMVVTELSNFFVSHVPFVPTTKADIEDMVDRVGITEADIFYDLGSGNGKVVFLVERLVKSQSKGLQHPGWTQTYAKLRARLSGSKAQFISGNFFNQPWQEATVIYGYLYPPLMTQVGEKALKECRSGTKLVIRDFPITTLKPQSTWQTPSNHTMYVYII